MADRLIRVALTIASTLAGMALVSMMLLTVLDFSLRFTSGSPIAGTFELTELAMVAIVFLGLGHGQRRRQHITIDLVYDVVGATGRRLVDNAARTIALLVAVLTGWQLWRYTAPGARGRRGERSPRSAAVPGGHRSAAGLRTVRRVALERSSGVFTWRLKW